MLPIIPPSGSLDLLLNRRHVAGLPVCASGQIQKGFSHARAMSHSLSTTVNRFPQSIHSPSTVLRSPTPEPGLTRLLSEQASCSCQPSLHVRTNSEEVQSWQQRDTLTFNRCHCPLARRPPTSRSQTPGCPFHYRFRCLLALMHMPTSFLQDTVSDLHAFQMLGFSSNRITHDAQVVDLSIGRPSQFFLPQKPNVRHSDLLHILRLEPHTPTHTTKSHTSGPIRHVPAI
jgi:hypothetical protein